MNAQSRVPAVLRFLIEDALVLAGRTTLLPRGLPAAVPPGDPFGEFLHGGHQVIHALGLLDSGAFEEERVDSPLALVGLAGEVLEAHGLSPAQVPDHGPR